MAKLVVLSEGLTGRTHELKVEKTTIGRVEENTFQIPEGSVSSRHCEVLLRGKEVVVRDLNSTNGTFVNGQQVNSEAVLKPGQILRVGNIEVRLEDESKAAASKTLPDKTMVIPQGVKLGQDQPANPTSFDKSGFAKKSNTGTKIFIAAAVVVGIAIIGFILFWVAKSGQLGSN